MARIEQLRLSFGARVKVLQSMAMAALDFAPWQASPWGLPGACQTAIVGVLFPGLAKHRCGDILLHVLVPGHTLDPSYTLLYRMICAIGQHRARQRRVRQIPPLPIRVGPYTLLVDSLLRLGIVLSGEGRACNDQGFAVSLTAPAEERSYKEWQHAWRHILRMGILQQVEAKRRDMAGVGRGIDRSRTRALYMTLANAQWKYHLCTVLSGAMITGQSRARLDPTVSSLCEVCQEEDNAHHRLWRCEKWQGIRDMWLTHAERSVVPELTQATGLIPLDSPMTMPQVLRVQAMLLHISLSATLMEIHGEQEDCVMPHPNMIGAWMNDPSIRKLKPETHPKPVGRERARADDEVLDHDRDDGDGSHEAITMMIGGHEVMRRGETDDALVCVRCRRVYAMHFAARYAMCPCTPGEGRIPKARLPSSSAKTDDTWKIPMHAGRGHDLCRVGMKIVCKCCGAKWHWTQRRLISKRPCLGSKHAEETRRRGIDEALPLVHNGHMPGLHRELNHLVCMNCAMTTRSEGVRGFNRRFCNLASGILLQVPSAVKRNRDRAVSYYAARDSRGLPVAKCLRCPYTLQWRLRARFSKAHTCMHC